MKSSQAATARAEYRDDKDGKMRVDPQRDIKVNNTLTALSDAIKAVKLSENDTVACNDSDDGKKKKSTLREIAEIVAVALVLTIIIKTFIGSGATVTSKAGKSYNLGYLLEHGTLNHAIPNAFNWGVIYGFDSERYFRTCRDDWHPGSIAIPHYKLALEKNKELYKGKIKLAFKKEVNK